MPNIKSAKKRLRQSVARRARNRAAKSTVRTQLRHVHEAADAGDHQRADNEFRVATKRLDQIAAHGVIHRNKAARLKSRLSAKLKAAKAQQ